MVDNEALEEGLSELGVSLPSKGGHRYQAIQQLVPSESLLQRFMFPSSPRETLKTTGGWTLQLVKFHLNANLTHVYIFCCQSPSVLLYADE